MRDHQLLDIAHVYMKHYITDQDIVIDMTMGNGYDTLFLAGISKFVYAFDIQEIALEHTKKRMEESGLQNYKLILANHNNVLTHVKAFKYVVYNLGYLPNGNKEITTKKNTTVKSLTKVLKHLQDNGMVFMVVYKGHNEGYEESKAIHLFLSTLDQNQYKVLKTYLPYQENRPPYLLCIYKKELTP
ncbi:tRNA (mnm(5)s(2)U34)-methyltransferase [Mariniplasma anaerobium]|uniref:SAM-dependent methyltransferase n=1 Tax=Mariniplasma anaerobium TaxID=2735436 RepID=A0A7U9TGT6_9MOLU|nr:class I SAM-dependent methyltransferase [Mariniplasma anaerobium]BCR36422.1 SAM-dependent methyltransferase [Mariniplasma anaerobium]